MKKLATGVLTAAVLLQSGIMTQPIIAKDTTNTQKDQDQRASMEKIKESFQQYVAGNETLNQDPALASKIQSINSAAKPAFESYMGKDTELFTGLSLDKTDTVDKANSDNLYKTTQNIYKMALAYATAGTEYYQKKEASDMICDAIQKFYDSTFSQYYDYRKDGLVFGNWWNWEIGMPTQMTNTFVVMEKEIKALDPALIGNYVKGFDNYLRNGKNGDVDLSAPQHTGTNLADITMNRILQGALIHDAPRIEKAASDMMSVFETIDPYHLKNGNTDGVYEDGSFIQHHRVAYTGSYGKLLLQRAVQSLIILNGTPWQPSSQLDTIQGWIYNSFAPLMYEGYMMEIVKGRAVSRTGTGYQDATGVIESMTLLTQFLNEDEKVQMQQQIKFMVNSMPTKLNPNSLTMAAVIPYQNIINDTAIQPSSQLGKGAYAFNAMDKNVQIGNGFAFALSRSSDRISKYEYMSGENLESWFQGDGAFYLYLSGRDQTKSFGADYLAAIDPFRLPGTTVPKEERKTIPALYNGSLFYPKHPAGSVFQNDYVYFPVGTNHFSGSVSLHGNSMAGMQLGDDNAYAAKQSGLLPEDMVVYQNTEANKSWFMFGDRILVVGSNIHDEQHRSVTTTIDNRMSDPSEITTATGGNDKMESALTSGEYQDLSWAHYQTNEAHTSIGYYFPQPKTVTVENGIRVGNLQDIRTINKDQEVTKNFFTMTYEHGIDPNKDSYSYVMLPNADEAQTKAYAKQPDLQMLENSDQVHVAHDLKQNITGYNFFAPGSSNGIESTSPVSIMKQESEDKMTLAVSDPLFDQDEISFYLDGTYQLVNGDERFTVSIVNGRTKVDVNTKQAYGASILATLELVVPDKEEPATPDEDQKDEDVPAEDKDQTPSHDDSKKEEAKKPVDTSDHSNPWMPAALVTVSFGTMIAVYRIARKKKKA